MPAFYELRRAMSGEYFFNLLAANGQNILKSEMYSSKSAAMNGIASAQTNCGDDARFECKTSGNSKTFFVLKARNHQVIGQSQMYESESGSSNGLESVKKNGITSDIRDLTAG